MSKSGQDGDSIGYEMSALTKLSRSVSPRPRNVVANSRNHVSGGIATSGCESSINLSKVVPERGAPTMIGIGANWVTTKHWFKWVFGALQENSDMTYSSAISLHVAPLSEANQSA